MVLTDGIPMVTDHVSEVPLQQGLNERSLSCSSLESQISTSVDDVDS